MKLSLKEMFVAVAILGLGFGFALHVRNTKQQLDKFQSNSHHASANRDFEYRMLLVEENFRRAGYILLGSLNDHRTGNGDGTLERKYDWETNGKPPISGMEFSELLRPIFSFTTTPHIRWDMTLEPTLQQIQSSPDATSGAIVIRVDYRF